ncbi:ABC transporter ATP-binding protein [Salisediminibacterium selenitireducens]|uniref:ABC transporter related protein n=1 Tax=Bacillus selenitireducens (strain ATCC 700615 / DSM 15326 / MLS10) TaxID=439292 RepID=D6XW55_BACIE|nr:phosphate ABC transporter ATP-binding protein [Salisediminibacterium selenitireducens]ADH99809.1 ABC transporter related protein [[Bacillus] selenitireducens MLS10]
MDILTAESVTNQRVRDVSLQVKENQIVTLIGPSGAGKTSLLYLFNRLMDPLEGTITYRGKPIADYPIEQLRKEVGMVFQSSSLFDGTVEDNLRFGPELWGEWDPSTGRSLMEQVGLPEDYLKKDTETLSGGEKQRVAFARTLANDPSVLLLDEVTSALDVQSVDVIESLLKKLVSTRVKAVMMVTHDVRQAKRLGDYTLYMEQGAIVEQGVTESMFLDPKTDELFQFLRK